MADQPEQRRLFSDKEISRILKRATELQEVEGPGDAAGLSMAELQQIAAEVGLDPHHIAAAAAELDAGRPADEAFHVLGAPLSFGVERVIEGEIPTSQWDEAVAQIHDAFRLIGASGQVGNTLEWTHHSRLQDAQVRVTSREGQTKIRVNAHYPRKAIITFLPFMIIGLQATIVTTAVLGLSPLVGLTLGFSLLATLFVALRFAFRGLYRRKERKAQKVVSQIAQMVVPPAAKTPQQEGVASSRIDPALLAPEEAPADDKTLQEARRTKSV